MVVSERLICKSEELKDSALGVRLEVQISGKLMPAFAVRQGGIVHAYINRCSHVAMELDWQPGRFFDAKGVDLICSTHGAVFAVRNGKCLGGPCAGGPLQKLDVADHDGAVFLLCNDQVK